MMDTTQKTKQLIKILIGAAWIDGVIQSEEREYLRTMAANFQITDDPELKPLLSELKPVQAEECYRWLQEYLGENHQEEDYQELLEAISGLIYSDGDVQTQEAKLLTKLQELEPSHEPAKFSCDRLLERIQKLYRKAMSLQA
ncbi:MAG: TerB family tellurite resistance protein [Snowella sp.]|nr:TerB family tellurite resistance protein [Snowella sp.]